MNKFLLLILFLNFSATNLFSEGELDLEGLIEEALKVNPELNATRLNWEAKKSRLRQAWALADPMIGVEYEQIPRGDRSLDNADMRFNTISQEIPFPWKLSLRAQIAKKEADIANQEYLAKEREIIKRVKEAFGELYISYKSLEIDKENKNLLIQVSKVAQTRYAIGATTQQDLLKAEVEVSKIENELIIQEQKRQTSQARLNLILNRDPHTELGIPKEYKEMNFKYSLDELYSIAKENRQELKSARFFVEKAKKEVNMAIAEYFPDFKLAFKERKSYSGMGGWDAMIEASLPIWFWEKQTFGVKEKKAELEMAKAMFRDLENMVNFEVKEAHLRLEATKKQVDLYKSSILPQSESAFKASQTGYEAGKIDFLSLLDSQRALLEFRIEYYQVGVDYQIALADLERAVGVDLE